MAQKTAVFPGSFDPFTVGHESVVRRAFTFFDKIIISVGVNATKNTYFSIEQRIEMINEVFASDNNVEVSSFSGLTVDYCKKINARYILRGLRTAADFEYERAIAQTNKALYNEIESVFLLTMPEHTMINSTIVRDVIRNGGNAAKFLPAGMKLPDVSLK